MLLYPPRGTYEKGPINSIRWELLREGMEDYEYLNMLNTKVNELESIIASGQGTPQQQAAWQSLADGGRVALAYADDVVFGLPTIPPANNDPIILDEPYTQDYTFLLNARELLAYYIQEIQVALNGM